MNPSRPAKPPASDNSFEFELTDFADAREALDNASIARAAEAARPAEPTDWSRRRRPRTASDRALTGAAIDWLLRMPPEVRPNRLSELMPRLVNQIAGAWSDKAWCLSALDDLLADKRGGRRGLPYQLREEVLKLQARRHAER
ncbi:hypothetical protein [Rhizobacter sp. Root404]|uniref:hypothetical protein n=1 Tax=Rhizobacter sp. Root404 TaxID=1736528 RepID=UPI0012F747A9|nr:hypothetical protein [Rhizobacter sp. Root404]